jgi:excisionase family DNA binding protein
MTATLWLNGKQAATYASLSEVTLRRAVQRGELRAYRVNGGHRVRYRAVDLDAWLSAHPIKAVAS